MFVPAELPIQQKLNPGREDNVSYDDILRVFRTASVYYKLNHQKLKQIIKDKLDDLISGKPQMYDFYFSIEFKSKVLV